MKKKLDRSQRNTEGLGLVARVCEVLREGGAQGLVVMNVGQVLDYADYFVIGHGLSPPHLRALINAVRDVAAELGMRTRHVEGRQGLRWVAFDLGSVVIHLFSEEARTYYGLETLWSDAPRQAIGEDIVDLKWAFC